MIHVLDAVLRDHNRSDRIPGSYTCHTPQGCERRGQTRTVPGSQPGARSSWHFPGLPSRLLPLASCGPCKSLLTANAISFSSQMLSHSRSCTDAIFAGINPSTSRKHISSGVVMLEALPISNVSTNSIQWSHSSHSMGNGIVTTPYFR